MFLNLYNTYFRKKDLVLLNFTYIVYLLCILSTRIHSLISHTHYEFVQDLEWCCEELFVLLLSSDYTGMQVLLPTFHLLP